jgi:hypothetical protein
VVFGMPLPQPGSQDLPARVRYLILERNAPAFLLFTSESCRGRQ